MGESEKGFITWDQILILIAVTIVLLTIVIGNCLVILAILVQKSLRTPPNVYLASLASIDLSVGVFILPFTIFQLINKSWEFGPIVCQIWLTADVTLCSLSIYHLIAIAVDRYRAITEGVCYVQGRSAKSVLMTIGCLWILAFWISTPPALGWNKHDWGEVPMEGTDKTICRLTSMPGYVIHSSLGAFIFPMLLMLFIYVQIFRKIQQLLRRKRKMPGLLETHTADSSDWDKDESTEDNLDDEDEETSKKTPLTSFKLFKRFFFKIDKDKPRKTGKAKPRPTSQIQEFMQKKLRFSLSKEKRAARTLGVIIMSFLICWLPFCCLYIIDAFLHGDHKADAFWFDLFTWLGYVNSAVNPFIYSVYNKDFRAAFKKILCFCRNRK